jgi:AAA family ATP:ADP antiporter
MKDKPFSFWRLIAWPVHRSETKKVVSMLILMSLLCICYSILRNIKDVIILTAKSSGAEVIPFIKVWGILPGAILATWFYTKLRSHFTREKVFYIIVGSFIAYFLLFAFVIFPYSDTLNLNVASEFLRQHLPAGFNGLIAMICNWTHTTFYIISEMWAVIVLTVLFWGFANDTTPLSEARRTYGLLNLGSNAAPIVGGMLANLFVHHLLVSPKTVTHEQWHITLIQLTLLISFFGLCAIGAFYWINRKVMTFTADEDAHAESVKNSAKKRLSLRDCIRYISKSKYLTCLALIVLGYNIAINFTDILWKEQLKKTFSDPKDMLAHMNHVTIGIGCFATLGGLFFSIMVRRLGWAFVALLTPALMLVLGIGFFSFLFFDDALTSISATLFGTTPLLMTVYWGSVQNALSKAGKYSVFDASKELAFLAVSPEARLRGKAAIDGLGSGVGKSGASLSFQALILSLGSITLCAPYIATILAFVFCAWIYSVISVSKEFNVKSKEAELA